MKKTVINHGDVILHSVKNITPPKSAKKAKLHVLEASATTGNRHQVVTKKRFIYRWKTKGIEYIHCDNGYEIQHVGGDCEHGTLKVPAGTRRLGHELEHDPFKNELRRVLD